MACKIIVTATYQEQLIRHVEFCCEGTCPDEAKCCVQTSFDHHGGSRTWCGCGPRELAECHLVLIAPGPGSGGGHPEIVCAGECPKEMRCLRRERKLPDNRIQYWCECV